MSEGNILLVEDDPNDEELIFLSLRKSKIANNVVVTRDGQEALDYLFGEGKYADRDTRELPEVVLLDMNLPKLSGLQVLQRLRGDSRTRLLPVVILTSSGSDKDRLQSYELGANSFVQKPINFTEFSEAIRHLGLYWLLMNKPAHRE